jgi:hypothetical protein
MAICVSVRLSFPNPAHSALTAFFPTTLAARSLVFFVGTQSLKMSAAAKKKVLLKVIILGDSGFVCNLGSVFFRCGNGVCLVFDS